MPITLVSKSTWLYNLIFLNVFSVSVCVRMQPLKFGGGFLVLPDTCLPVPHAQNLV